MDPSKLPPPTPVSSNPAVCPKCFGVPEIRLKTNWVEYLRCDECRYDWTHANPVSYPPAVAQAPNTRVISTGASRFSGVRMHVGKIWR